MQTEPNLTLAAQSVRRQDRERFVTALFAAPAVREDLMVLYAFNVEIARIRESVREAMAGMIRLQWWREVLAGDRNEEAARNPIAGPLVEMVRRHGLPTDLLEDMLLSREKELGVEAPETMADLEDYAATSAGTMAELGLLITGINNPEHRQAARNVGTAYALTGLLRALSVHVAQGRLYLPADALIKAGISAQQVLAGKAPREALSSVAKQVGMRAEVLIKQAREAKVPRPGRAIMLGAIQASTHLKTLKNVGWDAFQGEVLRPRPVPLRLSFNALIGRY